MKSVRLALLAALLACTPLVARAALLDFSFAFTNQQTQFLGGYVTGTVRGLTDDASSAASSVEILTNTSGFGLGKYIGVPVFNTWTVTGGVITAFSFAALGSSNTPPAVTCCSLVMTDNGWNIPDRRQRCGLRRSTRAADRHLHPHRRAGARDGVDLCHGACPRRAGPPPPAPRGGVTAQGGHLAACGQEAVR